MMRVNNYAGEMEYMQEGLRAYLAACNILRILAALLIPLLGVHPSPPLSRIPITSPSLL